jgi:hypothetical protein
MNSVDPVPPSVQSLDYWGAPWELGTVMTLGIVTGTPGAHLLSTSKEGAEMVEMPGFRA